MDYPHFSRQVLNTLRNIPNRCSFKCSPFHALFFKCCLHIGFRACLRHPQPQDCSCVIFYVIENVHLACNGASRYVSVSLPKICPAVVWNRYIIQDTPYSLSRSETHWIDSFRDTLHDRALRKKLLFTVFCGASTCLHLFCSVLPWTSQTLRLRVCVP